MIPITFIIRASNILGETSEGLSGSKIVKYCNDYAVEYNIDIPHSFCPFNDLPNKRTALMENLMKFKPLQQFRIIKDLCELDKFKENKSVQDLKIKLIDRFSHLNSEKSSDINETLIKETKHWLSEFPDSLKLYSEAYEKFDRKIYKRNLLDDIRLSLKLQLKQILKNEKSLEYQLKEIGQFIKEKKGSKEFANMFVKFIDYFSKYQNTYVKHNDSEIKSEIAFIFEMTSSFMRLLIRMKTNCNQ